MEAGSPRPAGKRLGIALAIAGIACMALAAPAHAGGTGYTVTNLTDAGDGSLRKAVADANAHAGSDIVNFQGGLTGQITLTTGQIMVTDPVNISGPGADVVTVSGNDASRIFAFDNVSGSSRLAGLRLTGGYQTGPGDECGCGGAILNFSSELEVEAATLDNNTAKWGGAIESFQSTLVVEDSFFEQNASTHRFGGGAIHSDSGKLTIRDSTIDGNTAAFHAAGVAAYGEEKTVIESSTISNNEATKDGGGILATKLSVLNSTIADNAAGKWAGGLGVFAKSTVKSSTVTDNDAKHGGGIAEDIKARPKLLNSIVAENTATGKGPDLFGKFTGRRSLIQRRKNAKVRGAGNIFGQDPLLGFLQNNGGPTETVALDPGSPAIDSASPSSSPLVDQRGYARGDDPDMGAFEYGAVP